MVMGLRMALELAKQLFRRSSLETWRSRSERLRCRILPSGERAEYVANTARRAGVRVDRPAASGVSVRNQSVARESRDLTDLFESSEPFLWVRVRRRRCKSEAACHVAPSSVGSDL